MHYALGLGFIIAAIVVAIWGDKPVQEKGGIVLKTFSWPKSRASELKFPIAVVLAGVGIWLLASGGIE
ncbi:MAG: hypothetical protein V4609_16575 [Pseudomonadota bacterium]